MVNASAQVTEIQLVQEAVNYYLDGLAANDFETIRKGFHEHATMKYIADTYQEVNAIDFFREMKPSTAERITRISSISFVGKAANVQVEMELKTYSYFDFLNLLKIDDRWKIVGKIYYKKMHNS